MHSRISQFIEIYKLRLNVKRGREVQIHSRPQSPRPFLVGARDRDLWPVPISEHAQSTRSVFSANQICQI